MIYIGQMHTAKYAGKEPQYKVGQRVYVFEDNVKMACFIVEKTNELEVSGKIVNTYVHKRHRIKTN